MIKSNRWGGRISSDKAIPSRFSFLMMVIALLLGGGLGMLIPFIVNYKIIGALGRVVPALVGPHFWVVVIAVIIMGLIVLLRQDELAATVIIAVHLYVDWYLGLAIVAQILALALLIMFFLARSPRYPWIEPNALWFWGLFLALAIFPAIRGGLSISDIFFYYPNLILGALIIFWLGAVIARDIASVRRLFQILSALGTLIAIHTLIQATTGSFLFGSARFDVFLASVSNFQLTTGLDVYRSGSFFIDPNWTGAFLAMMLCIPLGLLAESSFFLEKVLYLAQTFIILVAILFTYSAGASVAAVAGIIAFTAFVGCTRHRVQIPLFMAVATIGMVVLLPSQVNHLLQHATSPDEVMLRTGAWQTALQVIRAFPLTGVGLGFQAYLERAEPYRVWAQSIPLAHPHNSYLELGAMAGLPVLFVFVALIFYGLWLAVRNWATADVRARSLIGSGIAAVIALSVNSWSINGWTLPPIAATGWLVLGVISSPLLGMRGKSEMAQEKSINTMENFL